MNKSKVTLTFILLKLSELGSIFGLTFGIYYLGRLYNIIYKKESLGIFDDWLYGWLLLLFIFIAIGIIYLIVIFFKWVFKLNWKWAVMLNETQEERKIREKNNIKKNIKKNENNIEKNIEDLGYTVGDYVRLKKNKTGKYYLVERITWWGTYLKGYKDSECREKSEFMLVKKGKRHKDILGENK